MKSWILSLILVGTTSIVSAQESVKLSEMLDLEAKVALAKMKEELNKTTTPVPTVPIPNLPKVDFKPQQSEPYTVAVFGVSPDYKAHMNINGNVVLVSKGQKIEGRTIVDISKAGITMQEPVRVKHGKSTKRARHVVASSKVASSKAPSVVTRLYPIVVH